MRRERGQWFTLFSVLIVLGFLPPVFTAGDCLASDEPGLNGFKILIWPFRTSVLKDYDLYRDLGLGGFQIDRGAQSKTQIKLSVEKNFPFYAGHVADKGFLYLKKKHRAQVTRKNGLLERPFPFSDPAIIKKMKAHIRRNISALKSGNRIVYSLDDEPSLGTLTNPSDVDVSKGSVDGFRKWLKYQYQTIEALNLQWGTEFTVFDSVRPVGFEQIRKTLSPRFFSGWNLSAWMDFRQFMDEQFASVLSELVACANEADPGIPAGITGGQAPSPWGGYDYGRLSRSVQWMEAYDIHATNEILRSFWNRPQKIRMQTFFSTGDWKKDSWFLWYYLLHGNQGVIAWPQGWFRTVDGKRTAAGHVRSLAPIFKEIQGPVSGFVTDRNTVFSPDPIGIYYSHPSIRVGWAMDAMVHGNTWPNRLSSIDNENQSSGVLRKVWCKTLEDLGYQYEFINYLDVMEKKMDLNRRFRVIVLPKNVCLSEVETKKLVRFVEKGGVLIADYLCGIFDGHGRWKRNQSLDRLFGIERKDEAGYLNGKGITEIDGEKYQKDFQNRFTFYDGAETYQGMVVFERGLTREKEKGSSLVMIQKRSGQGTTHYLNLSPVQYWTAGKRFSAYGKNWRILISRILTSAGLRPRVKVLENGLENAMIESLFWKDKDNLYLGVVKNPSQGDASRFDFQPVTGEPVNIQLLFDRVVQLGNLRTGKTRRLQKGEEFSDQFLPWEANIYQVTFQE